MKPIRFILFFVILLFGQRLTGQAQNLVPNPSFEQYNSCPFGHSMFQTVDDWIAPNESTTDYLNACAAGTDVGIPVNYFGYQPARTGKGYAGIHPWQQGSSYREYAQVKLKQPLRAGEIYRVEFYVSLSSVFNTALSNMGAYLSANRPSAFSYGLLQNVNGPPQIRNSPSLMLTDTLNWMKIEGAYTAKGGEQYLTIGNFDDDAHTNYLPSENSPTLSYYYIDDVSVINCPILTDLGPDLQICPNDNFTLDASSPGATYRWQDGSTQPTLHVNKGGTYWVDVKVATCSFRDSVKVDMLTSLPQPMADISTCYGQNITLNAYHKGAISYRWQDGSQNPLFNTTEPGTYWVDVQFGNCSFRDTVKIRSPYSQLPPLSMLCKGQSVILDASVEGNKNATYSWYDGFVGPVRTVSEPGDYYVYIQSDFCYFQKEAKVAFFNTGLPPLVTVCPDQPYLLKARTPGALGYRWQDGSTDSTLAVNSSGIYWVDVRVANCTFRDSVEVRFLDELPVQHMKDVKLCPGGTAFLNAVIPGAIGYRWQDGSTDSYFYTYQPGTYWVDIELGSCSFRDSVVVSIIESNLASFTLLCHGEAQVLDATVDEPATYTWSDGFTGPIREVKEPGYYQVTIQTAHCQFDRYTEVSSNPPTLFYQKEIWVCSGQNVVLNPNQYNTFNGPFLWQDGSTNSTMLVDKPGLYWVEASWNNCTFRDTVRVQYYDEVPPLLPKALTLCQGQTYLLDASSAYSSYYWHDGSWLSTFLVTKPGTYWVEYYWNGCTIRSTTQVTYSNPTAQLADPDTSLCYGQSRTLELRGDNVSYRWPDGSTGSQFTVNRPGTYPLDVQDLVSGCTVRRDIRIVSKECWTDFNIPNIITPNGDEHNQYFVIEEITDHWGLEIFNRHGNRIYQASAYANNWDASGCPVGLYYYHLRNPYSGQSFKGWLQVME